MAAIIKNLGVLVTGSSLAQLIGVLLTPLLTRLYTPTEYGVSGSVLSIASILIVASSLRYEMALVLEKADVDAWSLQKICIYIVSAFVALLALVIYALPVIWEPHVSSEVAIYLPWLIPIVLLSGIFNIFNMRLNRDREYKVLSGALVLRRLFNSGVQVVFGYCGASAAGLLFGGVCGPVAAIGFILFLRKAGATKEELPGKSTKELVKGHYRFPAYSAPQTLMNSLSSQMPVFVLGYFFGAEMVGFYWFAVSLLQLPSALVGQAVRQVFYREAVDSKKDAKALCILYRKFVLCLMAGIALPSLVVCCFGSQLFAFIFGVEWAYSGVLAGPMMLWIGGSFINPPAMVLFNVFNKQKLLLIYDGALLLARGCVLLICCSFFSAYQSVLGFAIVTAIFYAGVIGYWWIRLSREGHKV